MKVLLLLSLLVLIFVSPAQQTPTQEAIEVIEGIFVGAFGNVGHEVKECIKDGEEIFHYIEEAVQNFEKKSKAGVIAGLEAIGRALRLLPAEVKDCKAFPELIKDIEKIAEEFMNPEELVIHVGIEILWHGRSIYHDVTYCIDDFHAKKYEPAGERIGDIIKLIFLKLRDPVIDAEDFLEEFFKAALGDNSVEIDDCITDAVEVIEELETIIQDIKNGFTSDIEKLFLDFIDLVSESVRSVAQCEKAPAEIDIMIGWVEQMEDISIMEKKLFNAFLFYPQRLKDDLQNMIDSFEAHEYGKSGFDLGDLLHILFVDVSSEVNEDYFDDAVKFVTGFYAKAFQIDLKLDTCEADVDEEWALVKKAIEELEHLSIQSIKEGIEDLMRAIPEFIQAFDECESDWPDLKRGLLELNVFIENPTKIPWAITKACTVHFLRVEGDCSQIYHSIHDIPHNFMIGGEGSGDLTALLLSELNMANAENQIVAELK